MATPLHCPHCAATFGLADWSRRAACPACGRRVSFFEASGRDAPDDIPATADVTPAGGPGSVPAAPAGPEAPWAGAAPPGGAPPPPARRRTFMGKPLGWTRGWTVVVAVWVIAIVLLFSARAGMGDLKTFRPEDEAALDSVPVARMPDGGARYGDALTAMDERLAWEAGERAPVSRTWYILPRPWEDRVYILLEVDRGAHGSFLLGWWVEDGTVTADPDTLSFLRAVMAPGAESRSISYPDDPAFLSGVVAGRVGTATVGTPTMPRSGR